MVGKPVIAAFKDAHLLILFMFGDNVVLEIMQSIEGLHATACEGAFEAKNLHKAAVAAARKSCGTDCPTMSSPNVFSQLTNIPGVFISFVT